MTVVVKWRESVEERAVRLPRDFVGQGSADPSLKDTGEAPCYTQTPNRHGARHIDRYHRISKLSQIPTRVHGGCDAHTLTTDHWIISCFTRSMRLFLHTSQERCSESGNNALSIALVDRSASSHHCDRSDA